jgi:hypothetical protein
VWFIREKKEENSFLNEHDEKTCTWNRAVSDEDEEEGKAEECDHI